MDIKQNADTGFLPVVDGDLVLITEKEAIRQDITRRVRTFLGEIFRDVSQGIDYYNIVFEKGIRDQTRLSEFQKVILSTAGVIRIEGFDFSIDSETRVATLKVQKVVTEDGFFPFETEVAA